MTETNELDTLYCSDEDGTEDEPLIRKNKHINQLQEPTVEPEDSTDVEDAFDSDAQSITNSRKHKRHYRSFRKDTPEELLLLKALKDTSPFTAKHKDKAASWERVVTWLKTHDEKRLSETPPKNVLFEGIQSRTCKLAWTRISKEFVEYQRRLKRATGVELVDGERIQLIEELYNTEQAAT
ncbi:hypothetical protein FBU30_004884, partial [Linnemannia zychae]